MSAHVHRHLIYTTALSETRNTFMAFEFHIVVLLLHPDKNPHPKAEEAFKLVSQVTWSTPYFLFLILIP